MNKQRALLDRLYARKRVRITPKNYLKSVKRVISTCFIFLAVIIGISLWALNFNYLSIAISVVIVCIAFKLFNFVTQNLRSTSIKGDALILTSINKRSVVTSIRSLQKIKSFHFIGLELTKMKYNLDGKECSSIIINREGAYPFSPERSIRKAYELSKKQKANYKPGSVTA